MDNNTAIDRETLSFYRLIVIAKDGASGAFQRTVSDIELYNYIKYVIFIYSMAVSDLSDPPGCILT